MTTITENVLITIQTIINAPVERVWKLWTNPMHIIHWHNASDDWHTTWAENDLHVGGKFLSRMEAKDGTSGFDFNGEYAKVELHKEIVYIIADGRKVQITFAPKGKETEVTETFEAEQINPVEMQQAGWQAILNNFKKYVEKVGDNEILHFEIIINADVEKVYRNMFDPGKWKEWTSEFNPTSRFEGSWEKGSKIRFLGTDENGNSGGMASKIRENIPNKFVSIEHIGVIQGNDVITNGAEVETWVGALENYSFSDKNGQTLLSVDMDSNDEFMSYFMDTWPKALGKLKEICEK